MQLKCGITKKKKGMLKMKDKKEKQAKSKFDKGRMGIRIIAFLLAVLMLLATAGTLVFYIMQ